MEEELVRTASRAGGRQAVSEMPGSLQGKAASSPRGLPGPLPASASLCLGICLRLHSVDSENED